MGEKNVPKAYRSTAKDHANLFKKSFLPMSIEFCIKRAGWKVTNFWTKKIKQKFILVNQKLWQVSNNINFGYDRRYNLDNCKFVPIFDKHWEVPFISRYHNFFDFKVRQFVTGDLLKRGIEEKFNDKL